MTDITERLRELSKARWDKDAWERETTVRIPAEPDRDIDLVLSNAAAEIDRLRARVAEFDALRQKAAAIDKLARSMVRDWGRREEAGYRFPYTVPLVISTRDACAPDDLVRQILGWAD